MKFLKVILIDDDAVTNFFNSEILSFFNSTLLIESFSDPEKAITHLVSYQNNDATKKILIFLDINMPLISGWDLLHTLEKEKSELFAYLQIHLLTSSIDENDKKRAAENPRISSILHKPLDEDILQQIFNQ